MKKIIDKTEEGIYWIEERNKISNQVGWFFINKNTFTDQKLKYEYFEYIGHANGEINDEIAFGEIIAFNDMVEYDIVNYIFSIFKSLKDGFDNMLSLLKFLEELINKLKIINYLEIQGIYAELFTIYNYNFFGKHYRNFNYSKKDFYLEKEEIFLEVKSTLSKNDNVYTISKNQLDSSKTIFSTVRLSKEGKQTNIFELYKIVKEFIPKSSFIHQYIKMHSKSALMEEIAYNLKQSELNFYNLYEFRNSFSVLSDRIINYRFDFDFSGLEKIDIKYLTEENINEIFREQR